MPSQYIIKIYVDLRLYPVIDGSIITYTSNSYVYYISPNYPNSMRSVFSFNTFAIKNGGTYFLNL